jgi:hypothetical protein
MSVLKLLLLAGLLLTGMTTASQEPSDPVVNVVATVDRNQVQIADPFELTIRASAPNETTISFPEFDKQIGAFDIVKVGQITKSADESDSDQQQWSQIFVLETIDSGEFEIPSIEVSVSDAAGSRILRTDPVMVSVASVVETNADLTKFNDIAGLIDVEEPQPTSSNLLWIVAVGVAIAALGLCGLLIANRPAALETSTVWALGNLDRAGGDFAQVESILRGFLEEKLELPAASLPAASLIGALESRRVDAKQIVGVKEILSVSERVKFGGLELSEQQNARLNESARALIEQLGATDLATSDQKEAV